MRSEKQMTDFRQVLDDCALVDIGFFSPKFT